MQTDNTAKKRIRITFNSPVILSFVGVCLLALILDKITGGISTLKLFSVYRSSFLNPLTYVRLIGHIFGHAGWSHFINNIMMILILGPMLEYPSGNIDNSGCNGCVSYDFQPVYKTSWSQRSRVCFYSAVVTYEL